MRVLVIALLVALVGAVPAQADPPFTPPTNALVGVGDDITERLMDALASTYNAKSPAPAAPVYSWGSTGGAIITPKVGAPQISRPRTCAHGLTLLATSRDVDFVRCARYSDDTRFFYARLADDTATYATAATSVVPTTLSTLALHDIYSAAAGSPACTYTAYLPGSSDTALLFLQEIGVATPGTCAKDTFGGAPVAPNDPAPVAGDPKAIVPFSVARAIGVTSLKLNSVDDSVRPVGSPPNVTSRVDPATGQPVAVGGIVGYHRTLYNVIRRADRTVAKYSAFFGPLGWMCTNAVARSIIVSHGFRRDPSCGA